MKKEMECNEQLKWNFEEPIKIGKTELAWIIPYFTTLILGYVFFK